MTLQEKLDHMFIDDKIEFIVNNSSSSKIKIIKTITIAEKPIKIYDHNIADYLQNDYYLRYLGRTFYNTCNYSIYFNYKIYKKSLFSKKIEYAEFDICDSVYFDTKEDAQFYADNVIYPSIRLNMDNFANYRIYMLCFNYIDADHFIFAYNDNVYSKNYRFNTVGSIHYWPDIEYESCPTLCNLEGLNDMLKPVDDSIKKLLELNEKDCKNKIGFIVADEIKRSEKYIQNLKKLL